MYYALRLGDWQAERCLREKRVPNSPCRGSEYGGCNEAIQQHKIPKNLTLDPFAVLGPSGSGTSCKKLSATRNIGLHGKFSGGCCSGRFCSSSLGCFHITFAMTPCYGSNGFSSPRKNRGLHFAILGTLEALDAGLFQKEQLMQSR